MRKLKFKKIYFIIRLARKRHIKNVRRKNIRHKRKLGWNKYLSDLRINLNSDTTNFNNSKNTNANYKKRFNYIHPQFSETIKYLSSKFNNKISNIKFKNNGGNFIVPSIFSLSDNYKESFSFLKALFFALYYQKYRHVRLDYSKCERIDIDASVMMDIILGEFILHFNSCQKSNYHVLVKDIKPINYDRDQIKKILFSIGAFTSIKGFQIKYTDIIPYPLRFGIINHKYASKIREVHITEMVDYVIRCMNKMGRILTAEAEANLFTIVGEILINAEDHSSGDKSFSIGYFQEKEENGEHVGIFHLVVLNFGKTIYEMFSDPACPNPEVVLEMRELSAEYTRRGFFSKAEFEEESLWTLYALQEGVTSKADWKRGNGSIQFIDSFFNLKGDNKKDNISSLSILSGNTRIVFDGTYRLRDRFKGKQMKKFKMMTFNDSGDISMAPDKKYVTFTEQYFPGTLISAKIFLKDFNTHKSI